MEREKKVAILIDGENISSKYVSIIINEANSLGNVIYKRIYGNWTTTVLNSWKQTVLDYSIQPVQQYSNTVGKNASDSSLIIEAMDLLYSGKLDCFCIVSSDSDFTRLAARLRESEMYVMGMGEQKTPRSFISACNKFSYLDLLLSSESAENADELNTARNMHNNTEKAGSDIKAIKKALVQLVQEKSDDDGWIFSGVLGNLVNKKYPDFDVRNFGHSKFMPFIRSLNLFEIKRSEGDNKLIFVKLKD